MDKIIVLLRKIRLSKKVLIPIVLLLVVFLFLVFKNRSNHVVPQFTSVYTEDLKQVVSASGTIAGQNNASLHFQGPGKLAFLNVKAGDTVSTGQVIAGLDAQQLSSTLQQAKNTLASNQAALEKVYDDIHLFQYGNGGFSNVGSSNETETQRATRIAAEQAVNNSVDTVKAAEDNLNNSVIISPINGIVTTADPLPGQNIAPTDTIVQVVDFSKIYFSSDVDEADIAKVHLGQMAQITLNSYGDKIFVGKVTEIVHQTHTATNGSTVVTVKIALDNQAVDTITGLNGQVDIITAQKKNLAIPQSALLDNNTVLVKTKGGIEKRSITTGFQSDTDIEVLSGLKDGDQVVTNPQDVVNTLNSQNFLSRLKKG